MATPSSFALAAAALALCAAFSPPGSAQTSYNAVGRVELIADQYPDLPERLFDVSSYTPSASPTGVRRAYAQAIFPGSFSTAFGLGTAWASSDTAGLHAYAVSRSNLDRGSPDYSSRIDTYASAAASFSDAFPLNVPGYAPGTLFTVTARVRIDADMAGASDLVHVPGQTSQAGAESIWESQVYVRREGGPDILGTLFNSGRCQFSSGSSYCDTVSPTGWQTLSFEMPNQSWSARLDMDLSVDTLINSYITGIGSAYGYALSDAGHTLAWGGITELRDASGVLVTDFSALSASSGFDYRNAYAAAVPEPQTWAMLMLGLAMFMLTRHRRRRA